MAFFSDGFSDGYKLTDEYSQSIGGTFTPTGLLDTIARYVLSVGGTLDLQGEFSAHNPDWLLVDDVMKWQGEWDALTSYDAYDVVLHKAYNKWHVFVSKTSHNVGNVPPVSPTYWQRFHQEPLNAHL